MLSKTKPPNHCEDAINMTGKYFRIDKLIDVKKIDPLEGYVWIDLIQQTVVNNKFW